jgi:outer membrane protein assembly factor BamB
VNISPCVLASLLFVIAAQGAELEKITNRWSFWVGTFSDSSPAIASDGTIYFGSFQGKLWALNPNGKPKWSFRARSEIKSSPAIASDGTIYFGSRDRCFYAISPEGKKKWSFKTGAWVDSSPAIGSDGSICFGSRDGTFYSLTPNGSLKWRFPSHGQIESSPAIGRTGRICFGSHDKNFYCLAADGAKQWEFKTRGAIISSPALDEKDGSYFTSIDGFLYALNADGTLKWKLHTGGITQSSPVVGTDGSIFVGVNDEVWQVSTEGKKLWAQSFNWHDFFEAPPLILKDGSVCHISRYGMLMCMNPADRNLKWMYYLTGHGSASPAVGDDGTVYLSSGSVDFVALATKIPLAETAWPKFRGNSRNTGNMANR